MCGMYLRMNVMPYANSSDRKHIKNFELKEAQANIEIFEQSVSHIVHVLLYAYSRSNTPTVCMYIFLLPSTKFQFASSSTSTKIQASQANIEQCFGYCAILGPFVWAKMRSASLRFSSSRRYTHIHMCNKYTLMAIYIGDATHPHTDVTAVSVSVCVYLYAAYTYDDNVLKCLSMGADL